MVPTKVVPTIVFIIPFFLRELFTQISGHRFSGHRLGTLQWALDPPLSGHRLVVTAEWAPLSGRRLMGTA